MIPHQQPVEARAFQSLSQGEPGPQVGRLGLDTNRDAWHESKMGH